MNAEVSFPPTTSMMAARVSATPVVANGRPILTLGLVPGGWQQAIGALLDDAFEGSMRSPCLEGWLSGGAEPESFPIESLPATHAWGVFDDRLLAAHEAISVRLPGARYFVVVESPQSAVANGGADSTAAQRLQRWSAGAQQVLALIRRRRGQCLIVSLDDCLADPEGLVAALEGQFGLRARDSLRFAIAASSDAVDELLARTLLRARPAAQIMYEELLASCLPLGGGVAETEVLPPQNLERDAQIASNALDRLRQLRHDLSGVEAQRAAAQAGQAALEQRLADRERHSSELHAQLQARQAELETLVGQVDAVRGELEIAQHNHVESRQEAELLLLQLHKVQEELEALFFARRDVEQKFADNVEQAAKERAASEARHVETMARLSAELETERSAAGRYRQMAEESQREVNILAGQLADLKQYVCQLTHGLDAASSETGSHFASLEELKLQVSELIRDRDDARQESDLLLTQLHHVREELEHYYLAWREADGREASRERVAREGAEAADAARSAADFDIGRVLITGERREAPHRELSLRLESVRIGERAHTAADLRLVEHNGRPGFVLFADRDAGPPLSAWIEHGREGTRPYMLVLPSDSSFDAVWRQLPRSEWQLLTALPDAIDKALDGHDELAAIWRQLGRKLACQLAELPARLRYDALSAEVADDGLRVRFTRALFGPRTLGEIVLRWQPAQRALWVVRSQQCDTLTALTTWPLDEQGEPLAEWRVPVTGGRRPERIRCWDTVSRGDRELVLALLDALPAAVDRLPAQADLRRQAAELLQIALTELGGGRIKRALRYRLQPSGGVRA